MCVFQYHTLYVNVVWRFCGAVLPELAARLPSAAATWSTAVAAGAGAAAAGGHISSVNAESKSAGELPGSASGERKSQCREEEPVERERAGGERRRRW